MSSDKYSKSDMGTIIDSASLKRQIAYLEQQQEVQKKAVGTEVSYFMDGLKPANLIKSMFHSVKQSPDLKSDLMHGADRKSVV